MQSKTLHAGLLLAALAACQPVSEQARVAAEFPLRCPDTRPEVCTQQYDPVCASTGAGRRQTFSNACHACADRRVQAYRPGRCDGD